MNTQYGYLLIHGGYNNKTCAIEVENMGSNEGQKKTKKVQMRIPAMITCLKSVSMSNYRILLKPFSSQISWNCYGIELEARRDDGEQLSLSTAKSMPHVRQAIMS